MAAEWHRPLRLFCDEYPAAERGVGINDAAQRAARCHSLP